MLVGIVAIVAVVGLAIFWSGVNGGLSAVGQATSSCRDSDGGLYPNVAGGVEPLGSTSVTADTCASATSVSEKTCGTSGAVVSKIVACAAGYTCTTEPVLIFGTKYSAGRCVPPRCADSDGDGYQGRSPSGCTRGTTLDCNDADRNIRPGATDYCDNIDQDCDGIAIENCPTCTDSDGGQNAATGGSTTTISPVGWPYFTTPLVDSCISSGILNESVCASYTPSGSYGTVNPVACGTGKTCIDPDGPSGSTPARCG